MTNDVFEVVFNESDQTFNASYNNDDPTLDADFGEVLVVDKGGTTDHEKLKNRDAVDQHPMSAITGLEEALEGKQPSGAYLTEETDPTVPEWAKQETKPSYTAKEVGALSAEELPGAVNLALKQAKDSGEFDGPAGKDGYTPVKGVDYFDGQPGKDGNDGKDGKDGQPGKDGYTPVKGVDYFDGAPGKDGEDGAQGPAGYTPVKGVDYFDGETGPAGYTPVKGVDYYTEAEKAEIIQEVVASVKDGNTEEWVFELEDGSTVIKTVVIG